MHGSGRLHFSHLFFLNFMHGEEGGGAEPVMLRCGFFGRRGIPWRKGIVEI